MSEAADLLLLTAPSGINALVSTRGATLVGLSIPDRQGQFADVVLGFDTDAEYRRHPELYFGCTVGRVANRIAGGMFDLDGARVRVTRNDGANCLHGGGEESFGRVIWSASHVRGKDYDVATMRHTSPDGADGFPGTVEATVTYTLLADTLRVDWEATTDRRTPISLTNHTYWNLAGAGHQTVLDHELHLAAGRYLPVGDELLPTGTSAPVAGTPFDFQRTRQIGDRIGELGDGPHDGYDHHFLFEADRDPALPVARVRDAGSGRVVELLTDHPGVQLYSGNFLYPLRGKGGLRYGWRSAVCLEPQSPPDALHHPSFGSIIIEPGEVYHRSMMFRFTTD